MSNLKKDDNTKKADTTTPTAKGGNNAGNIADTKKSGNAKEERPAGTTKIGADKKGMADNKNPKNK